MPASIDTKDAAWAPTIWEGENAFAATSEQWLAIVSVDRARLVYLGDRKMLHNLLFAPGSRDTRDGWGGHRLWLGPQTTWAHGWPPPDAWEKSKAESVEAHGGRLELRLPDAGDGWPRLARVYEWKEGRLHCDAVSSGGTRPAQLIHIVQIPSSSEVEVRATPRSSLPMGYAQIHLGRSPSPQPVFAVLPQVSERAGLLLLRPAVDAEKLGFEAQPLLARIGGSHLRVERGMGAGVALSTPDDGLVTQVYFGQSATPFMELEQLSSLLQPGGEAHFEIILIPRAP